MSRSELYAKALRKILADDEGITARLDEVYADGGEEPDPFLEAAARRALTSTRW